MIVTVIKSLWAFFPKLAQSQGNETGQSQVSFFVMHCKIGNCITYTCTCAVTQRVLLKNYQSEISFLSPR